MKWLPTSSNFRERLARANVTADPEARLSQLGAIANHQLTFVESLQLDAALSQIPISAHPHFEQVRLALLGGSTVDHLAPQLRIAGLRHGLRFELYVCPFGQFRQELFDPNSPLQAFRPEFVLQTSPARDFLGDASLMGGKEADEAIENALGELGQIWGKAQALGAQVMQQTFLDTAPAIFGSMDIAIAGTAARNIALLNSRLSNAANPNKVLLLDIGRFSAFDGLSYWFDRRHWFQSKIEIAPLAAPKYAEYVARLVGACRGRSRKCLVLDLDNTLWGGVVGDDGLGGIALGQGDAVGEAYLAMQAYAKAMHKRGVLLAVCSKNDEAVAMEAFTSHPDMVLHLDDFAAFHAGWTDKVEALIAIASKLNVGLESLVFVDDNPSERERVRLALPMVSVPELPEDPAEYVERLSSAGYFEAISFTPDDASRNASYAADRKRDDIQTSASSLDDFLTGLGMTVVWTALREVDIARASQLINKTNQFNTTGRRLSEVDLARFEAAADSSVLTFRLTDRFGDLGVVSVVLLSKSPHDHRTVNVECWVMSCRVFGRQLEHEIMNILVEFVHGSGYEAISARLVPTARNTVIKDLFADLGFSPATNGTSGLSSWRLELKMYSPFTTRIARAGP